MPTQDPTSSPGSSQSREVQIVPFDTDLFHDVIEVVIAPDGRQCAVIKKICDNLEAAFWPQLRKMKNNPAFSIIMMVIETPAGPRETWVIPITKIAWWLSTINAKKVKASLSPKLLKYQEACADVLDAWCRGKTREQVTSSRPLSPAEALLQSVQLMVDLDRRQKEVEAKTKEVDDRVNAIEEARDEAFLDMMAMPGPMIDAPQKDQIDLTVERARLYQRKTNLIYSEIFHKLFREVRIRIGIDAVAQYRNGRKYRPARYRQIVDVYRKEPLETQQEIYAIACEIWPCNGGPSIVG